MILWSRSITDPSGGNTQSEQKRKEECIPTMKGKGAPSTPVKKRITLKYRENQIKNWKKNSEHQKMGCSEIKQRRE